MPTTNPPAISALEALLQCPDCGFELRRDAGRESFACGRCGERFPEESGVVCFVRELNDYTDNYDQICADDLREPKTPEIVKQIFTKLVLERARGVTCDLGCGDGHILRRVQTPARVAVDIALPYLERLPDSILRLRAPVERVPLKEGSIDTIICTDVIEHVLDAQPLADEMDRLLAQDGQILLAFPFEQDLSVYDLPEYKAKFGKYKYVHLRSMSDSTIRELFPRYDATFTHLITEGMPMMLFKPYPIQFLQLTRTTNGRH